ncbi:DUF2911 domain-containing protein [Ulvibacterium sp.]|uniref:DUF2911 domain-containing protein n=1 Tax=Ulvibacterium sp. TaxID=2665914 RepID=UPI003BAC4AD5
MKKYAVIGILLFLFFGIHGANAQDMLVATKVSQRATITQRIGTTDVTVVYHSPLAKGRKIFGGIVPYDFVVDGVEYPWRAGSNENTTIEFTHDVMVAGKSLPKGKYGLHIFVKENEWVYIFSKNSKSWGSFSYNKEEDALRVTAVPKKVSYQEWLSYDFVSREPESAVLELHWSDVKCGIQISVDVTANVLTDLKNKEEKTVDDYIKIAQLALAQNPGDVVKALDYVEKSLDIKKEFRNTILKSELLEKKGRVKESQKYREEAIALGEGFPYFYYYPLSFMLLEGDKEKTFSILSAMLQKEPDNYIVHLATGEYYIKDNNQEKATFHFGKAYEYAGERSKAYTRYMYLSNKLILEQK